MNAYLDILIFAVIAVVLLWRLRSVLGQRSEDDVPSMKATIQTKDGVKDITGLATAEFAEGQAAQSDQRWAQGAPDFNAVASATVHNNLAQFLAFDPTFRPRDFQEKARKAYGMIVKAFSEGNRNTLQFLLSPDLYKVFEAQLDEREKNRETYFVQLHSVKTIIIEDAELNGSVARITADFVAEQAITHKDADGRIIEERDGTRDTTKDRWVFERDLKGASPSWLLVQVLAHEE
jgi:predicted lipid-binding transport protein (Tim44 family)